jgi:hypothetical protein
MEGDRLGACRDEKPNKDQLKPEVWIYVGADAYFWSDGVRREPNRICEPAFERSRGLLGIFSGRLNQLTCPKQFQQVMSGADQLPFRLCLLESAEQKGADATGSFDLSEDRLHNRFAHLV